MIIPDLNLLIYAYNELAPYHKQAKQWWEDALSSNVFVGIPWIVVVGFVRLMTHRQVLDDPLAVEPCCDLIEEWFERPNVQPLTPGLRHLQLFRSFLSAVGSGGNLATDAHLAALALEYNGEIHSNDADFSRFPGVRVVNPLTSDR